LLEDGIAAELLRRLRLFMSEISTGRNCIMANGCEELEYTLVGPEGDLPFNL